MSGLGRGILALVLFSLSHGCGSGQQERQRCVEGETRCWRACVDLETDAANCGRCGEVCGEGLICKARACVPPCEEGLSLCGETCVDTSADARNCGACGETCRANERCMEGSCKRPPCAQSLTYCEGVCVDLERNAEHCGGCGLSCGEGERCVSSFCRPTCEGAGILCGERCVDPEADEDHCGGCGVSCGVGETCSEGACVCAAGHRPCGKECVDTANDPLSCGECFHSCQNRAHASASVCEEGACEAVCDPGYGDCDEEWANGCEVELLRSKRSCGACGNDCEGKQEVVAAVCVEGKCQVLKCEDGWDDCDSVGANGCETQLLHDAEHCGTCGVACASLANALNSGCNEGQCAFVCADGWGDCDGDWRSGCEADLREDGALHCGACNQFCEPYEICRRGSCVTDLEWANWPMPPDAPTDYDWLAKEGVVVDRVTGLEWQREASAEGMGKLEQALDYCTELRLAGHEDWRLPTIIQLASLLDMGVPSPSPLINQAAFPAEPAERYWASTIYLVDGVPSGSWAIDFRSGSISRVNAVGKVRCVRGGFVRELSRYVVRDGSVEDRHTGLIWARAHRAGIERPEDGVAYCNDRALAGYKDWRAPSMKELLTIVDVRQGDPMLDWSAFSSTRVGPFWSGTKRGSSLLIVNFGPGTSHVFSAQPPMQRNFRCVRDAAP